ncbi:glycine receptor subunit alpha-4 [Galendromus occidentalis]|uniref:Glycine receptor subunit alpha-4 n=1 Tax=Galendromus occidentalis TaxID=34638 RepID=A0AAJ6QWZ0_9ACAR|nr:glycine receptor subunit alpha-4 [Galendromus occidentalis]
MRLEFVVGLQAALILCSPNLVSCDDTIHCAERRPNDVHGVLRCLIDQKHISRAPPYTVNVNVSVRTLSITSPDDTSLDYVFHMIVTEKYIDTRLRFKVYQAGRYHHGLNAFPYRNSLWTPKLLPVENDPPSNFPTFWERVTVFPSGEVHFRRRIKVALTCRTTMDIFPFDHPVCKFSLYAAGYRRDQVHLSWDHHAPAFILSEGLSNVNAPPVRVEVASCSIEEQATYNAACIKASTILARDHIVYWVTLYVPSIVLVTSAFMTFWLKATPPRSMIGTTTRLTYISTTNNLRNQLSSVSSLVSLNVWDSVSIIIIYFCILEFIFTDYLGRHPRAYEKEDEKFLEEASARSSLTFCDKMILYLRRPNAKIANDIDVFCRIAVPLVYLKFLIGYFVANHSVFAEDVERTLKAYKDFMD